MECVTNSANINYISNYKDFFMIFFWFCNHLIFSYKTKVIIPVSIQRKLSFDDSQWNSLLKTLMLPPKGE